MSFHRPYTKRRLALVCLAAAGLAAIGSGQTTVPASPPVLPPAPPATSQPASRPAADLPPARQIVDRAIEAAGGRSALKSIKSIRYNVTASTAGAETTMTLRSEGADRLLVNAQTPGGPIEMGRLGMVAWTNTGNGYALVPEDRIGQVSQLDLLGLVLTLDERVSEFTTVDEVPFGGTQCFKVQMADGSAGPTYGYFDTKGGALRGLDQTQASPMGKMLITTTLDQPKRIAPLTVFTQATMTAGPQPLATLTLSDVVFNPDDDFAVTIPPEVAELVEKRKTAGATSRPSVPAPGATSRPAATKSTKSGDPDSPAVRKMLASLRTITDVGQLNMMASVIEAQIAQVSADEKPNMEFLARKIRERIAEIEGD